MTKKNYVELAKALRSVPSVDCWETWYGCVVAVATVLAANNPRFDYGKFYAACGIN